MKRERVIRRSNMRDDIRNSITLASRFSMLRIFWISFETMLKYLFFSAVQFCAHALYFQEAQQPLLNAASRIPLQVRILLTILMTRRLTSNADEREQTMDLPI